MVFSWYIKTFSKPADGYRGECVSDNTDSEIGCGWWVQTIRVKTNYRFDTQSKSDKKSEECQNYCFFKSVAIKRVEEFIYLVFI